MEIWKDIPKFEGIYQASTHGRIRTCEGKTTQSVRHGTRVWKQRILSQFTRHDKRKRVTLWKNKKPHYELVHRLVATTFLPNDESKPFINHIDGDPQNNHISNLEWCTSKENNNHAFDNGLMATNKRTLLYLKGKTLEFRSMSMASQHLGLNPGAISEARIRGKNEVNGVKFEVDM